jgi:outer membrane protein assembly factor BamB
VPFNTVAVILGSKGKKMKLTKNKAVSHISSPPNKIMKKLIFAFVWLLLTIPCSAEIIIVDEEWPYDYDNIQAAIDYSANGDIILVFPGTYTGPGDYNIDFLGKAIIVRSLFPTDPCFVAQTIIDCNGHGGAFYFVNGEDANSVLDGFTVTNAREGGINCYSGSSPTITNCVVTGNSALNYLGGIYCLESSPTITNCTINGNGGCGISCLDSSLTITNCTISNNDGDGISCGGGNPTITNCTITGNSSDYHDGSGIYCENGSPTITDCNIRGNSGSGIECDDHSSPAITNCTITGNHGGNWYNGGGGVCCGYQSSPTITNCIITDNSGDYGGGGIYCEYECNPTITNCTITSNSAYNGGGIYCYGSPTITNCTITGNFASDGGGIYYSGGGSPVITGCIITGNYARGGNGGGICCDPSIPTIANCTISGNSAHTYGGGIYRNHWTFVTNSIIWGNDDSSGTGQSAQVHCDGGGLNVSFSCIQGYNPNDANMQFGNIDFNIDDDPCFVALGSGYWDDNSTPGYYDDDFWVWSDGDYHLLPASPCIEAGDHYYTYHPGDVDIDGQPRLMGRYIDMGADEVELAVTVVTKPKGGEILADTALHEIKWDSFGITGTVDIYFSANNGADWEVIKNNAPDTGSYFCNLPFWLAPSSQCLIAVRPTAPISNLLCIPSSLFTLIPGSLPGPPVQSEWKSLGGDFDRTGLSETDGPELGCVQWQFQTDGPVTASVTIGLNNRVHVPCEDGKLYTLDANGVLLWSYDANSPLISSPSIGPDGSVYVGAENGMLYAIDIDGNPRWTFSTDGIIYSSPAISADGDIFVCSQDGTIYALAQDGSELWSFETDSASAVTTGAIFASPSIGPDGTVYIAGLYDPNLYAINASDGSVMWSSTFSDPCDPYLKRPRPFASPVIAAGGTIYISSPIFDPYLYAIDSNDGSVIWSTNLADPCYAYKYGWSEPALGPDGTIYVSFNDPYLTAVDPNGTIRWVTRLGEMGGFTLTVGSDGLIYAASDDSYLCVIDPDGEEIARFKGDSWLSFPVITADNTIIIVSDANNTVWAIGDLGCEGQTAALHRPQDLSEDWAVSFEDFALVANDWLKFNCYAYSDEFPPCDEYPDEGFYFTGDIDRDLYVDFADLSELADNWLSQE